MRLAAHPLLRNEHLFDVRAMLFRLVFAVGEKFGGCFGLSFVFVVVLVMFVNFMPKLFAGAFLVIFSPISCRTYLPGVNSSSIFV